MQFRGLKSTHINEELMFVFFVCSDESAFRLNVAVAGKTLDSRRIEYPALVEYLTLHVNTIKKRERLNEYIGYATKAVDLTCQKSPASM